MFYVANNITLAPVSREFDTFEKAEGLCRALNLDPYRLGIYGVYRNGERILQPPTKEN